MGKRSSGVITILDNTATTTVLVSPGLCDTPVRVAPPLSNRLTFKINDDDECLVAIPFTEPSARTAGFLGGS
jgi:hypothetical protein